MKNKTNNFLVSKNNNILLNMNVMYEKKHEKRFYINTYLLNYLGFYYLYLILKKL